MTERIRVLLVDHQDGSAIADELLLGASSWQFAVSSVSTLQDTLQSLAECPFDAVLLSLTLPDSAGLATLRAVRQASATAHVVVLAQEEDAELALRCAHEGAEDYVIKGQCMGAFLRLMVLSARERHLLKRQLREARDLLRTVIDNIPDAIYVKDAMGRKVLANRADLAHIGVDSEEEVLNKTDAEVFGPETAAHTEANDRIVLRDGRPVIEQEEFGRYPDGTPSWGLTTKIPLRDAEGRVIGLVGISRDITERKIAEEQLRESERRYRTILQTALDGFWLVDTQARLLEVNEAYCQMSGYSRDELLSMQVPDLEIAETPGDVAARIQSLMEQGEDRFETQHRRKDGSILDVEIALRYTAMEGGRIVVILRDITERKIADQALRQSQKMEAMGQLAGGVAHDLNNMLSVINGYSQMALEDLPKSSQLYKDIGEIKNAGDRSARLTRQLLTFARRQAIAPRMLDLNAATEEMLRMLRRLVGENVKLVWEPGNGLWPVMIDPGQVDQILANLVVNARDAITGVGTVTIATANAELGAGYCRTHVDSRPGEYVMITVTDDGCGMGEDVLEHIFEPFFTTKPTGQGTGLGLAAVYGITKQNGGSIDVSSEPGTGTTFRIYIPRHVTVSDTAALNPELADAPRGTETVLVVEDEVALLQLVCRILTQLGYSVLSAATPHEALRLVATYGDRIDLLLTDVVMPEMGGRQLQQTLAASNPTIKWLFMSGYTDSTLNQQGVHDSDLHLLQKPFTRAQLAHHVRAALDES